MTKSEIVMSDFQIEYGRPWGEEHGDGYRVWLIEKNEKDGAIKRFGYLGGGGTGKKAGRNKTYWEFWRSQAIATINNYLRKNNG